MYLIFDTETTGLPVNFQAPLTDSANWPRLVELAWAVHDEDGTQRSTKRLMVRPDGFNIPAEATRLHGISTEQADKEGLPLQEVMTQMIAATGNCRYLVGHNLEFDLAIVGAELHRLGRSTFGEGLQPICTMRMGTGLGMKEYGSKPPKLYELHSALFGEELIGAHRAATDVAATTRCLFELLRRGVALQAPHGPVQAAAPQPKPAMPVLDLDNQEFQLALNLIENTNRSVFLTGKAGTGKSTFLRHIVAHTRKKAVVVAPTGVAALNAGGVTIHKMFVLPFGVMQPNDYRVKYFGPIQGGKFINEDKYKLLQAVELVIVDEVSMVRADILDAIDYTLRRNSRRNEPFGGKQMLLVGDAYQLPPVLVPADRELYARNYQTRYFFGAKVFSKFPLITVELQKAYRQQDPNFVRLLDRVRTNQANATDIGNLNGRTTNTQKTAGRKITLSTRNADAESYNANELSKLTTPLVKYIGVVNGEFAESDFPTARELVLKEGAQVMFVHNDRNGRWVNGSIGRAIKVEAGRVKVEIESGAAHAVEAVTWDKFAYGLDEKTGHIVSSVIGTFTQLPLKLAWALTVHKSQGLTFDAVEINAPTGFFDAGQLYVALSRCRSFEGLQLRTLVRERDVQVSQEVIELHRSANNEQQVTEALQEARPNKLYQQSLKLWNRGQLAEAVAALCEALSLRNDAHKPLFARLLRHKLHGFVQAKKQLVELGAAHEAEKVAIRIEAAAQLAKVARAERIQQQKTVLIAQEKQRLGYEYEQKLKTQQQEFQVNLAGSVTKLQTAVIEKNKLQKQLQLAHKQCEEIKRELDKERLENRPWWQKLIDNISTT